MNNKAVIVNTGVICNIGNDTQQCFQFLQSQNAALHFPKHLSTFWKETFPVGEVDQSNTQLAERVGVSPLWPRTALLSTCAAQEALTPISNTALLNEIGFFSANTVGGIDLTENIFAALLKDKEAGKNHQFIHHECGAVTELVAAHFGLGGFCTTISTACSSSANSIMMAAQMIEDGLLRCALAGGTDALSRFTLNGFNTLMIVDKELCQPFDKHRRGLNLGEGAAYLLIMSEALADELQLQKIAFVSGYANANDAYHQTASSPEGAGNQLAMRNALSRAGLQPKDISYINAHGTGTPNNDSSECAAIQNVFETACPPFSSTKSYTGHTLAASGAVEAVFSTLSLKHDMIFPNLRHREAMDDVQITPVTRLQTSAGLKHVLSNSFGFGGNCSSLIFSKIKV